MKKTHLYPLKLAPFLPDPPHPWGGHRLRTELGKAVPDGQIMGESWELSDHPGGFSRIADGPHAGTEFGRLVRDDPQGMLGIKIGPERYPILIKYIDAAQNLSIQVHPTDTQATGDRGKTECWYIMDCEERAEIICGLKESVTADDLRRAVEAALNGDQAAIEGIIQRRPIKRGSFVSIPAGTVHAILGGTLLCEVQQASNTTYRIWDWNRQPPRELHIEDAARVARFGPGNAPEVTDTSGWIGERLLETNPFFKVSLWSWRGGREGALQQAQPAALAVENPHGVAINVLEGDAYWEIPGSAAPHGQGRLIRGESWFWPSGLERAEISDIGPGGLRLLVTKALELGR